VQGTGTAGTIAVTLPFPGAPASDSYDHVEIRRVAGAAAPAAACNGGSDYVMDFTTWSNLNFTDSTGLTEGQYYSYRVCVYGLDGSKVSTTTVTNVRAKPACDGTEYGGYCWYLAAAQTSCTTACSSHGGTNNTGGAWAGANTANCNNVHNALGTPGSSSNDFANGDTGIGCFLYNNNARFRDSAAGYGASTTPNASIYKRVCACQY
jgi:hypothetical protein